MILHAIIADDLPANIETMQALINEYCPNVTVKATATDADTAYLLINEIRPDIVFLDIEMPASNGFDLLQRFKSRSFEVIFTTAYDQYAVKAFGENALDYLVKPINIDLLIQAVTKAANIIELRKNSSIHQVSTSAANISISKIRLPVQEGYLFVEYNDLVRCEGMGSYSNCYMADGKKILISMRLKECEDILPASIFFRVHNSHIINLNYVSKYYRGRGGYTQLNDGTTVEVSSSKKDAFLEAMKLK